MKMKLPGAWRLTSFKTQPVGEKVKVIYPYGPNPKGILTYVAGNKPDRGWVSVQIMSATHSNSMLIPRSKPFSIEDLEKIVEHPKKRDLDQMVAAFETYDAYYGSYTIQKAGRITHYVHGSLLADVLKEKKQVRDFAFRGNQLILSENVKENGRLAAITTVTWSRLK